MEAIKRVPENGNHGQSRPKSRRTVHTKLVWKCITGGYKMGALHHPYDVKFLPSGDTVVAEGCWPESRLQVFSEQGKSLRFIGEGRTLPFGIAVTKEEHIAVTDHTDRTVKIFSASGEFLTSWGTAKFDWPIGIALNKAGRFVVADWAKHTVNILDENGTCIHDFKTGQKNQEELSCPDYVAVDQHDRIIVSDSNDCCIKIYDPTGKFLMKCGPTEGREYTAAKPKGVCVDSRNNILVADRGNHTVSMYNTDGAFVQHLLTSKEGIQNPWGIHANSAGYLAITEEKLNTVPAVKVYSGV